MKKQLFLLIGILLLLLKHLSAQSDNPYVQKVDSMTANLNKSFIATGILYDRAAPLANLDLFNSQLDTSDYEFFSQAYFELFYAAYNTSGWQTPGQSDSLIWDNNISGIVPIGVLDYQFNMTDSFAVSDNLFTYQNGLLYDVAGRPRSPYFSKRVQLVAPLAYSINAGIIKLKYLPELFKSNSGYTISSITITGLTQSPVNLPLDGTTVDVTVTTGYKSMQIQVNYTNGQQFTRIAGLRVNGTGMTERITGEGPPPNDQYWLSSTIPFQGYTEPAAYNGKNQISIYSRGNNTLKPIIKPVIILDGFDPTDKRNAPKIYDEAFKYKDQFNQPSNFADELRASGFDLVVVDHPTYNDNTRTRNDQNNLLPYFNITIPGTGIRLSTVNGGGDYIQRNAMVLVELIQRINSELQANGSQEKIIIVGPSMGGQISRYALRYMETHGMNHNCKLWVSFDSPHQGALLPIGLQWLANGLKSVSNAAKKSLDVQINCPATKEMVVHHYLSEQELPAGAPGFKDRYYQEIDNLGWPSCRKIAMISGADNGSSIQPGVGGQAAVSVSGKLFQGSRFLLFKLVGIFIHPELIGATCYLSPNSQQSRNKVLDGHILFRDLITRYSQAPPVAVQTLDLIPSGFYPGFAELKETSDKTWSKKFGRFFISQNINAVLNNHAHEFVYSTLALGKGPFPNPNRKWDDDISKINVTCGLEKESPFDAYWGPDVNTKHDSLLYGHVIRLKDEFIGIQMPNKTITQTISSDNTRWCVNTRKTFQILNPKQGQTFVWGTSDPSLVIRSGQGTAVVEIEYTSGTTGSSPYVSLQSTHPCYNIVVPNLNVSIGTPVIYSGFYTYTNYPYGSPMGLVEAVDGGYNKVCYTVKPTTMNTQMDIRGATDVVWEKDYSTPSLLLWGQNGNNLTIDFRGTNQMGEFILSASNTCGTTSKSYIFKSVTCSNFFRVSPNPAASNVTVAVDNNKTASSEQDSDLSIDEVRIYDTQGNLKKNQKFNKAKSASIDVSALGFGVYIIEITNGDYVERQQLLIQR